MIPNTIESLLALDSPPTCVIHSLQATLDCCSAGDFWMETDYTLCYGGAHKHILWSAWCWSCWFRKYLCPFIVHIENCLSLWIVIFSFTSYLHHLRKLLLPGPTAYERWWVQKNKGEREVNHVGWLAFSAYRKPVLSRMNSPDRCSPEID